VHLYEELGCECLKRLDGMFALAILDLDRQTLLLARDRAGMKHLYCGETEAGFVFASEAKALFAAGLVKAEPNLRAIDTYLAVGYVPSPMSAFQGVARLMPGEYLLAGAGPLRRDFFWRLAYRHERAHRTDDEYADELDHLPAGRRACRPAGYGAGLHPRLSRHDGGGRVPEGRAARRRPGAPSRTDVSTSGAHLPSVGGQHRVRAYALRSPYSVRRLL